MTDFTKMEKEGIINYENARNLYDKSPRPSQTDEENRVKRQFTITPETDFIWRDFITTYSGVAPTRGKGISSAMVELAMKLLVGIVADFKVEELAEELRYVLNETARKNVRTNLQKLIEYLE